MAFLLALAGCSDAPPQAETDNAAFTDVEALPPDESVDPPAEEPGDNAADPDSAVAPQE